VTTGPATGPEAGAGLPAGPATSAGSGSQRPVFEALRAALRQTRPAALATVTGLEPEAGEAAEESPAVSLGAKLLVVPTDSAPEIVGSLGNPDLDRVVTRDVLAAVESGLTVSRHYGKRGEARQTSVEVFIEVFAPPPRLIIFGAVDFTAALASVGRLLGYHVVVCDARAVFATVERFPMAHEVIVEWPDRYLNRVGEDLGPRDAVCVLTHDAKFDVPAVLSAMQTRVGYLGAMGSRRTHEERWRRLLDAGADPEALSTRLMSPIGLAIGARTPEETAIAICAEIIACRTATPVPSLRAGAGPIHSR
jgi:xanthine dehydrogenase accessory factor